MKYLFVLMYFLTNFFAHAQEAGPVSHKVTLPNGWSLTPAGNSVPLGDLPLNIEINKKAGLAAVTNNGQSTQSIQLVDLNSMTILDTREIEKAWLGLKFAGNGKKLYASGGNDNWILEYAVKRRKLILKDSIKLGDKWPNPISPAGLDIDDRRKLLYVVTKDNNSLYTIDLRSKKVIRQIKLDGEAYTCLLSPDKKELYISCWGCDQLVVYNTIANAISKQIKVGDNPNDICFTKDGMYLFVSNSNDNSVSVINTQTKSVIETLTCSLFPDAPQGSTSNSLALSEDDGTLYIANADNNCLSVFDVHEPGKSSSKGFIPTGWYPTCVRVNGRNIFVANGKGFSSFPNPYGPNPVRKREQVTYQRGDTAQIVKVQYIGGLFIGSLSKIAEPSAADLGKYSEQVYSNSPYTKEKESISKGEPGNPIPQKVGDASPIKHVFYIVKENRTYDQVLGDMPEGNGDSSLVLFGENVTPNQHKLAREFVLLDNFYVDGEVSADGHNWSMGAYATDFLEKTWVTSYGGRGGTYDSEGNREVANNKNGFIWDNCKRAGVTYRTYGEFADDYKANIPVLEGHFCPYYTSWDQRVRDTTRVSQWKRDFDSLVAANALPQLNTLRMINDHTEGLVVGRPTPFAHTADNDLAVGLFVEYLSQSPVWKESVVFIVEDDAQNGPDHVDAHRTTAYLAGPFVKRNFIDHTPYTTSGMLRTMELILGLPPMSQYDAAATPMWRCFTAAADTGRFVHLPSRVDLTEVNVENNELSQRSAAFNFSKEDAINDFDFNEVLWKGIKGMDAVVPPPRRAAFLKTSGEKEEDDDDDD